jgi:hypothetical protein
VFKKIRHAFAASLTVKPLFFSISTSAYRTALWHSLKYTSFTVQGERTMFYAFRNLLNAGSQLLRGNLSRAISFSGQLQQAGWCSPMYSDAASVFTGP